MTIKLTRKQTDAIMTFILIIVVGLIIGFVKIVAAIWDMIINWLS